MNKEIEDILKVLDDGSQSGMIVEVSPAVDSSNNVIEDDCSIAYSRNEILANRIYDAGYRKADEVRKETAKEILGIVGDAVIPGIFGGVLRNEEWFRNLCGKYGVEVGE